MYPRNLTRTRIHVDIHLHSYMHICVYVHICMHTCVYMWVCIHIVLADTEHRAASVCVHVHTYGRITYCASRSSLCTCIYKWVYIHIVLAGIRHRVTVAQVLLAKRQRKYFFSSATYVYISDFAKQQRKYSFSSAVVARVFLFLCRFAKSDMYTYVYTCALNYICMYE